MSTLRGTLIDILTTRRWPLSDEKALQPLMLAEFDRAGIAGIQREVSLGGGGDIVDFLICGIAIEVKIKGARRAIFRQVERYCGHEAVEEIILATNVPMSLPAEMGGKQVTIAAIGRGWL